MNDRQTVLDRLDCDAIEAIHNADLTPLQDGRRTISARLQRRVLKFYGSFSSDKCWLSCAQVALHIDHAERSVAACVRALVRADLLVESGPKTRRVRCVHWTEIGRRIDRENRTAGPIEQDNCPVPRSCRTGPFVSGGPVEPDRSGPTYQNQLPKSSSSRERPTTAKDFGSNWEPAAEALRAVGLGQVAKAIELAKAAGLAPVELVDLALIVRHAGRLQPGAIIARLRDGCWPVDGIPDADEIRHRIQRKAEKIRQARHDAAATAESRPQRWVVDGLVGRDLRKAGLIDLATGAEAAAADRMEELDRVRADRLALA